MLVPNFESAENPDPQQSIGKPPTQHVDSSISPRDYEKAIIEKLQVPAFGVSAGFRLFRQQQPGPVSGHRAITL
jgi:hypothetical protein